MVNIPLHAVLVQFGDIYVVNFPCAETISFPELGLLMLVAVIYEAEFKICSY